MGLERPLLVEGQQLDQQRAEPDAVGDTGEVGCGGQAFLHPRPDRAERERHHVVLGAEVVLHHRRA